MGWMNDGTVILENNNSSKLNNKKTLQLDFKLEVEIHSQYDASDDVNGAFINIYIIIV